MSQDREVDPTNEAVDNLARRHGISHIQARSILSTSGDDQHELAAAIRDAVHFPQARY